MMPAFMRAGHLLSRKYLGHPLRVFGATLKTFFICHVFWEYLYEFSPTQGASMLPTFEVTGDYVLASKWYRRGRGIAVGDVVTFGSVREPGERVIKRVIGLEGDCVCMNTPGSGSDAMIQVRGCCSGVTARGGGGGAEGELGSAGPLLGRGRQYAGFAGLEGVGAAADGAHKGEDPGKGVSLVGAEMD